MSNRGSPYAVDMPDRAVSGAPGSPHVRLRPYTGEDARATLGVFVAAVTGTAAADYTPEQVAAWVGGATRVPPAGDRDSGGTGVGGASAGVSAGVSPGHVDEGGPGARMVPDPSLARDLGEWDRARRSALTVVAVMEDSTQEGGVVGFGGLIGTGHIDMLFVAPGHGRRGIATALLHRLTELASSRGAVGLTADVSLTARAFFEANGFRVLAEQHPVRNGVQLVNHRMARTVSGAE